MGQMKLLTKADAARIPPLRSQENNLNPTAYVKFFDPFGPWTWFVLEHDGNGLFFGLVYGDDVELGHFSLADLESARGVIKRLTVNSKQVEMSHTGIERDKFFNPTPIREVIAEMSKRGYPTPVAYADTPPPARKWTCEICGDDTPDNLVFDMTDYTRCLATNNDEKEYRGKPPAIWLVDGVSAEIGEPVGCPRCGAGIDGRDTKATEQAKETHDDTTARPDTNGRHGLHRRPDRPRSEGGQEERQTHPQAQAQQERAQACG